jgi:glycosyltransferase involved in cell wall biosynthesis
MNVIIRGPLLSTTGYGVHSRQVFSWALSKGWNVRVIIVPWGICTYHINPGAEDGLIAEIMERSHPFPQHMIPDLSLQIQLPDEWDPKLAKNNIGITAGVEGTICSPEWIKNCQAMQHVIVPSNFTRDTFVRCGLAEDKISAVPESYSCGFKEVPGGLEMREALSSLPTSFNFLMFGQLTGQNPETDRKNTFWGLKWFAEQFKDDPDVGLIVKTNMGRMTTVDRSRTTDLFNALLREIRPGPYPRFYLAHGLMDKNEITELYMSDHVKALLAPTRGEGWGLPILDAAVCGLPVIATNYSGHMDFLKKVKFLPVEYESAPVPPSKIDGRIWVEGAEWVDIKEESFKRRISKFRKSPDLPKKWAIDGAEKLREEYSLDSIIKQYNILWENLIDRS